MQRLLHAYQQVRVGNPLDEGVLMGPLIDERALEEFRIALEEVVQDGGQILCGGGVIEGPGFFVEPTIVRAENQWKVVQRETFAPILYVMPYATLDDAIALQNQAPQGLSSSSVYLTCAACRTVFVGARERLRDCECEYRHLGRGDWRRLWRGEGNGRGARGRF